MYKELILLLLLLLFSCSLNDPKGKFIGEEIEHNAYYSIVDSLWENYKVTEYMFFDSSFKHRYHFKNDTQPYEYWFMLRGQLMMHFEGLNGGEAYKTGSNIYLLSKEAVNDSIEVKVVFACPYVHASCLYVDILAEHNDGGIDTLESKYNPKADILLLMIGDDENVKNLHFQTFLFDSEIDQLKIEL